MGVGYRLLVDVGDERAELRDDRDEPLVAQTRQRIAHGRAADADQLGELVLRQPPPRLQLRADDRLAQGGIRLITRRHSERALAEGGPHLAY